MVPPPRPRESTLSRDCGQSSHLAVAQGMGLGITVSGRNSPDAGAPKLGELREVVSAQAKSTISRSSWPLPVAQL